MGLLADSALEIVKLVGPAVLGVLGGLLGAWITTRSKLPMIATLGKSVLYL